MIELTDPQSWVIIGVFATAIFGMLSWQTVYIHRSISSLADRFDATIGGLRDATASRFDQQRDTTNAKFEMLGSKIDGLDRDVQALTRHVFGTDPH